MNTRLSLLLTIGGGLLFSILLTVVWWNANHDRGEVQFGHIIAVTETGFTLTDRDDRRTKVAIASSTIIEHRRDLKATTDLTPGMFVQVTGERQESGDLSATHIRQLRPPKSDHDE